ncbi:MFS transporter [Streptomyces sp. MS1.HAVA.3]|uniref:MFS transporter n=1 Tax=Streptomyces caledonius TaxID=3134107 RepID=A0ABU8TXW4_9ACTN
MVHEEELLDGAARVLAGDHSASMVQIAAGIGTSRATLSRRYATREALLKAVAVRAIEVVDGCLAPLDLADGDEGADGAAFDAALEELVLALMPAAHLYGFTSRDATVLADPEFRAGVDRQDQRALAFLALGQRLGGCAPTCRRTGSGTRSGDCSTRPPKACATATSPPPDRPPGPDVLPQRNAARRAASRRRPRTLNRPAPCTHPERNLMHTPAPAPRRWIVLAILSGSLLLISMDTTILNVAFPSLVGDLQPGAVQQLWIIDVYALALSGLLVTAGALGDRWGRKRLLMVGFGIFSLASLIAVFSTEAWHVIAARALLGIGGAAIMPSTVSILRTVFTDAKERAFALAVWAAVFGGGMAFGPVVGGLLVQDHGWHSAFLLNLPVAAVIVAAGLRHLPESRSPRSAGRWDWWGVGQSIVGMLALAGGIKQLGKSGVADPLPWALLLVAVLALTVFVRRQLRLDNPLLQVRLFAKPAFSVAATAIFLPMVGMGAILFLVTQWFQYGEGYTPLQAGVRLLPAPLALIAASMVAPSLMQRFAIRHVLGAGLVVLAAGMALPWTFQQFTDLGYPAFAAALTVMGAGAGIATTVASVTLVSAAPAAEVSSAAAIEETCYELGSAMGVAVLGSTAAALYRGDLPALDLDGPTAAAVRDSVGEAAHTAERLGGAVGQALLDTASHAFTLAITPAFLMAGGLAVAAAATTWALIPRDLRPTENH